MSGVIEAYAIGTKVTIGGDIPGTITGVAFYEGETQYRVTWWKGNARTLEWLTSHEVKPTDETPRKIGFRPISEPDKYTADWKVSGTVAAASLIGSRTTA